MSIPLSSSAHHSLRRSLTVLLMAFALFLVSAVLIREHAETLAMVQDDVLPIAGNVSTLQAHLEALAAQSDLAQRASAGRATSLKEQLSAYVMPSTPDQARSVALLEALMRRLQLENHLTSAVSVDAGSVAPSALVPGASALPLHVTLQVDEEGARSAIAFLRLTGMLTVGDALTSSQSALLLRSVEEGNPADIVALEQFLQTDLLAYAAASDAAEGRLLAGVSAPSFADTFHAVQKDSLLPEAREILGGDFGKILRDAKLWPSPFLLVSAVALRPGMDGRQALSLQLESLGKRVDEH